MTESAPPVCYTWAKAMPHKGEGGQAYESRAEFTWKDTDGGLLVSVRGEIDHHGCRHPDRHGCFAVCTPPGTSRAGSVGCHLHGQLRTGAHHGALRHPAGAGRQYVRRDPSPEIRGTDAGGHGAAGAHRVHKRTPPAAPDRQSPRSERAGSGRTAAPGRTGQKRRRVI